MKHNTPGRQSKAVKAGTNGGDDALHLTNQGLLSPYTILRWDRTVSILLLLLKSAIFILCILLLLVFFLSDLETASFLAILLLQQS